MSAHLLARPTRGMQIRPRWRRGATALLLVAAIGMTSCGGSSNGRFTLAGTDAAATYEFVVPAGTSEAVQHGTTVDIIPSPFVMKVGEVVRIRNDDEVGYTVGPFYVGPHQTMTQAATSPGVFAGACSLHTGGELLVRIVR